ncbi:MAG: hypothetical protein ABSD89_15575 [Halobacteriota archaeon]|jgi:hypothetical protein
MKKVLLSAFAFLLFTLGAAAQSKVYFAPVIAASITKNIDGLTPTGEESEAYNASLCVTMFPIVATPLFNPVTGALENGDSKKWCVDFNKVHVYVGNPGGTYASVNYHHAKDDLGYSHDFADFITIFVSTENQRQQYQDKINWWNHYLFDARDVPLQDFNDFPSGPN